MTMTTYATATFLSTFLVTITLAACGGGGSAPAESTAPVTPPVDSGNSTVTLATADFVASTLSQSPVGPAGGVLTVSGSADPMGGAVISIPAGALSEPVAVSLGQPP